MTGKFDAPYWEVFEHAFSHALGEPISLNSDKKKKTYFQKIYDEGGLLACKDYRECLMYILTHRLHELTKIRNKLYHEGGRVVELCNVYEFLRDVFAYFINIYGMKTLLNMIENMPLALKAWLLLSLKYFEKVEEKQVSEAYLIDSWKEISSSIERNLGVKLLRLLEQLFEGNKSSFSIISDKISQLKPFNIFEVMVVLKDRVITDQWDKIYTASCDLEQGILRSSTFYTSREEEAKAVIDWYDKATEIKVIHRNSKFYGASEYDKKELYRFLSSTDKIIVKACIEKIPFRYIFSAVYKPY